MQASVCLIAKVLAHASLIMLAVSLTLDKSVVPALVEIKIIYHVCYNGFSSLLQVYKMLGC